MMASRSLLCVLFVVCAFTPSGIAEDSSAPVSAMTADPVAVLTAARQLYDFSSATLKPWHLKASYQLYDPVTKSIEPGTYEYWWASPEVYRSTWTRGKNTHTDWHTSGGKVAVLETGESPNFFEYRLQTKLLSPLPDPQDHEQQGTSIVRKSIEVGNTEVPCLMIVPKMAHGKWENFPLGVFPTYCFDPKFGAVISSTSFGGMGVLYDNFVRVQGHYLPKSLAEAEGGLKILMASVETIDGLNPGDPALVPAADARITDVGERFVPIEVLGWPIAGPTPDYSLEARIHLASGIVNVKIWVGRDGMVHDLKVISAAYPSLAEAAMRAIVQWRFKPYLVNGDPVEVTSQFAIDYLRR